MGKHDQNCNSRPNIVFVMSDDHAPWAFGRGACPDAVTPVLDRLASEGCLLENYFAMSPVCSPARAALLTSRYSTETGITDFLPRGSDIGLEPDFVTWPRLLRDAGYATGLFGKWHVGELDRHHPTRHGYEEFKGWRAGAGISLDPVVEVDGQDVKVKGYTPDILTDYALDFIDRQAAGPFLLSLHFWAPHANTETRTDDGDRTWHPLASEDWEHFKDIDPVVPHADYPGLDIPRVKRMLREYLAAVHSLDRNLGRLLSYLDATGLGDNTIVVYTSDNGYNLGHNGIWHKGNGWWILNDDRGARPNIYDNSLRLPAIVRWPGVTTPGSRLADVVNSMDWFPTLCTAAGVDDLGRHRIRGRDMQALLAGQAANWDPELFAQYRFWDWNQTGASLRMVRTPEWKLVRDLRRTVPDEFYYLTEDPAERHNLIGIDEPQIRKHIALLDERMRARMMAIADPDLELLK